MVKVTELQFMLLIMWIYSLSAWLGGGRGSRGGGWCDGEDCLPKTKLQKQREFKRSGKHQGKYL